MTFFTQGCRWKDLAHLKCGNIKSKLQRNFSLKTFIKIILL